MSNFETSPFNYGNNNTHKRRAKTPSFSSILLDAIYRSIDDTDGAIGDDLTYDYTTSDHNYGYNNYSKQRRSKMRSDSTFETLNLGHAIMIESWMEKQQSQPYDHGNVVDDQSIRTVRHKSVPSRAATTVVSDNFSKIHTSCFAPPTKRETASSRIFTKTKSKAMKIYGDLKKNPPKSPTSPGAKIAAFINSIFRNSGNRKPNIPPPTPVTEPSTSTSCLSKATSTSRGKSSSTSRSVRFYTVDEDSSPRINRSKSRREKAKEIDALMTMIKRNCREREEGEASLSLDGINGGAGGDEEMNDGDDGDDGESCGSSDLFELESLSCIGVSRYAEELPVYGTTSLHMIKG